MKRLFRYLTATAIAVMMAACTEPNIGVTEVKLDQNKLIIAVGKTASLKATISPTNADNQKVTWTSSAESIATVSNGVVSAMAKGSATITVTTDDGAKVDRCEVTVTPKLSGTIAVTGVQLDQKTLTVTVGDTSILKATVAPKDADNKKVTWISSDSAVAAVTEGVINALKEGTTTITVKTDDGGFTDKCAVTVKQAGSGVIKVTGVKLNAATLTLIVEENAALKATVSPDNADNRNVTWASDDPAVATVVEGTVTAVKAGTATITVKTDDGGFTDKCAVTVEAATVQGILINGVTWSEFNVNTPGTFVSKTEEFGMYYKWGSKVGWSSTDPIADSNGGTTWDAAGIDGVSWPSNDDPCPAGWRVPTIQEIWSLTFEDMNERENPNVSWDYVTQNEVNGYEFIDKHSGARLFMPCAGYRFGPNGNLIQNQGFYWSASSQPEAPSYGYRLYFGKDFVGDGGVIYEMLEAFGFTDHKLAMPIRCVRIQKNLSQN